MYDNEILRNREIFGYFKNPAVFNHPAAIQFFGSLLIRLWLRLQLHNHDKIYYFSEKPRLASETTAVTSTRTATPPR
jgi:hypothetical protein